MFDSLRTDRRFALLAGAAFCALASAAQAQTAPPTAPDSLDEVVVTGSRLSGAQKLAPVEILDHRTLDRAGVTDAAQVLQLLTANSGSEARVDQLNQPQSSGTAQFNLRNLGLGSTLVLVDGLRWTSSAAVAADGSNFVDINSLVPLIALRRIETFKDGASALYGSDAVAGVVNFITRDGVDQPELRVRYGFMDGADETLIEALGGLRVAGGDLTLAASHLHRSALGSDERAFTQAQTYGRAAWTAVTSYGQPGSYFRPSTNAYAPDPNCTNPAFTHAFRNSPTDAFCRLDYSDFFDLSPEETRTQLFAGWRRTVGAVDVRLQAAWSSTETIARQSPSLPILARSLTVPASHPDNPFGEAVQFRGRLLGAEAGASQAEFDYRTWRLAGGLAGRFASGWTWDLSATSSRQHIAYDKPDVIGTALQNALNGLGGAGCNPATGTPGAGPCRYFNPFGSAYLRTGSANDPTLVAGLIGSTGLRGAATLTTVDAQTSGRALNWTGGGADLAFGVQYRRSGLRHDWSDLVNAGELLTAGYSPDFDGDQEVFSAFAEARIRLGDAIEAQLAARQEVYDGGESALSPRVAVRWDVADALTLRASWGQGFRNPSVYALAGAQASQPSVFDRGAFVFVNTLTTGDPDLKPEESETLTAGAVWAPLRGLQIGLDAWRIDYTNLIVKESAQAVIDRATADDLAGLTGTAAQARVTRAPGGALTFVDLRFANASSIETQGLDLSARYERDLFDGRFSASATWTYVDRYDIRLAPGAPTTSGLGSTNLNTLARSMPQDRGEFALGWSGPSDTITVLAHYTGGYRNDRSGITDPTIDHWTTVDLQYVRALSSALDLSLGVMNVADSDPPLAQFALGYDPIAADPRGRVISIGLTKRF
ncbi:TonB-dependent siderophore receptor [Brevundimonas sp.]|uniref:TonB-dependent receptor plug domain-containing protein n=1 Tax=Brevundimonas sp. TaxID=1871086 RepID=UPI0025C0662B|nr:TonB-dependent receptor [Brevundimonas sp.]